MQWAALFVQQFSSVCRTVDFDNKRTKNVNDMLLLSLERQVHRSKKSSNCSLISSNV